MLDAMARVVDRNPIDSAVNTHSNPDHSFGNELLPTAAEIYASRATAEEVNQFTPELLQTLKSAPGRPEELVDFVELAFGPFDFDGITVRAPSHTFSGQLDLRVGGREVRLIELGPAHTAGDTLVYVPDSATAFTGDLLFIDGTPIVWSDLSNWIVACDQMLELGAEILVPGHGPVTDASGIRDVQRYLRYIQREARERFEAGMDAETAADDIDIHEFADWGDRERIAVNVIAAYRELDPSLGPATPLELFMRMARWRARH